MARRIVVPLDGTEHSELALSTLPRLCDFEDEIVLLSIGEPSQAIQAGMRPGRVIRGASANRSLPDLPVYVETEDQVIQSQLDDLQTYLQAKANELRALGFNNVQLAVEINSEPAEAILDLARRLDPSFIVMVRTTRPGIGERLFGTVAQHVVREDVAPVVIVPGRH